MIAAYPAGVPSFGAMSVPQLFGGQAQCFFVDNTPHGLGNDGNDGMSPSSPVLSVARGYQLLRDGFNDTLFLIGTNTAYTLTAPLVWAKNFAHLVGITNPLLVSQRVRITSGVGTFSPVIKWTGVGCATRNIQIAQFGSSATLNALAALVQGQRNYFANVHFAGGGNATNRGGTVMRSCTVDGQGGNGEHVFDECVFGLDTVDTAGVNFELEFLGDTPRNYFRNCKFIRRVVAGGEGGGFINFPAVSIDRWTIFDNPTFVNFIIGGGAASTTAITLTATTGLVIMRNAMSVGATGFSGGTKTNLLMDPVVGTGTSGLSLEPST